MRGPLAAWSKGKVDGAGGEVVAGEAKRGGCGRCLLDLDHGEAKRGGGGPLGWIRTEQWSPWVRGARGRVGAWGVRGT